MRPGSEGRTRPWDTALMTIGMIIIAERAGP
jgi:hypothetical protein